MAAEKHDCVMCPVEVRNLYATARNVVIGYNNSTRSVEDQNRFALKMDTLSRAVEGLKPLVESHFEVTSPRPKTGVLAQLSQQ